MDIEKVGKAITFLRKRAGYTQKDLAERLGVSDKAVSKWERGLGLPDVSYLRKLSILLDTDTDSLLAGDVVHHGTGWRGLLVLDENPCGISLSTVVYDKPLANYLLSYFLLVGIREILVLCSEAEKVWLAQEFGNGSTLGIKLLYSDDGIERAMAEHPDLSECRSYMVVYGRSLIYGVDQTRFFQKAMIFEDRLTVLSMPRGMKPQGKKLDFNDNNKVVSGDEEEIITQYSYYDIPIFFCPTKMIGQLVKGKNVAFNFSDCEGRQSVYTTVLDRGFVELPMDTWDDVTQASNFVQIVQKACGMNIYCIEEIAWRRGMISTEELKCFGCKNRQTFYGKYILSLTEAE